MKRILTLNTWGAYGPNVQSRWNHLTQSITTLNPDIACFQEVFDQRLADKILTDCGFEYSYIPSLKSGLMIASQTPLNNTGFLNYSKHSLLDGVKRQCIYVEVIWNQQPILVTSTHLSWKSNETIFRTDQLRELTEMIERKNMPTLMCGDYNCEFTSQEFDAMKQNGFCDTMRGFPDEINPTWDNRNPFIQSHRTKFPDRRVDLILTNELGSEQLKIRNSEIALKKADSNQIFPSDHYGVCCEIAIGDCD